jgi:hypothetical protein
MLKRLNSLIPLLLAAVFILLAFAWYQSERGRTDDIVCQRDYNAAQSQRQQVLNDYTTARDYQRGVRDAAHSRLLNGNWVRGSQENIDALDDFNRADRKVTTAETALGTAREAYPPPRFEDYCTRVKALPRKDLPDPKVPGTTSPKSPNPAK